MLIRMALVLVCLGGMFAQAGLAWAEGKMYWTDCDEIKRANQDGTNVEEPLRLKAVRPLGIALDVAGGKIYWGDGKCGKIKRANLDGTMVEDLVSGLGSPSGIALDVAGGKMYWTDARSNARKIQRANLDGSTVEDLVTGLASPAGIALDVAGGKMYWTDASAHKIQRANLDGMLVEDLVSGLDQPFGIALDVAGDKMYWTDASAHKIQRANLNGNMIEDLVTTGLILPIDMTLDVAGGKMYWTDLGTDKIRRADLDGMLVEDLVSGLDQPIGIALDLAGDKMYWTNIGADKIQRANLDGTLVEDLVSGLDAPFGIALDVAGGKMYWTDIGADKIQRANLDGTLVEDLATTGPASRGIALDVTGGKVYWTDSSDVSIDKIKRANLDGSMIEDLVTTGLNSPQGIALDVAGGKMYWVDDGTGKIQRANLDGSMIEDLVGGLDRPNGIALDVVGGKMYWIDNWIMPKIQRANLDGSMIEDVVTGLRFPRGIALDLRPPALDHYLCYRTKESRGKLCTDGVPNEGAVCTSDTDCGSVTGSCVRNKFARRLQVDLADDIETKLFDVKRPVALCNPVDKNGEGIGDADTHLKSYYIRKANRQPSHVTHTSIHLENQFHPLFSELYLDTIRPDRLLVPTAKDLSIPVDKLDPANHNVDHFKCYRAKISKGTEAFPKGVTAHVVDQFNQPTLYKLKNPQRLCYPVDKNEEGIKDTAARLVCYLVKSATKICGAGAPENEGGICTKEANCGGMRGQTSWCQKQAKHVKQSPLFVNNQFGPELLDTIRVEELCVPSVEVLP